MGNLPSGVHGRIFESVERFAETLNSWTWPSCGTIFSDSKAIDNEVPRVKDGLEPIHYKYDPDMRTPCRGSKHAYMYLGGCIFEIAATPHFFPIQNHLFSSTLPRIILLPPPPPLQYPLALTYLQRIQDGEDSEAQHGR
jgi:hypothetical protein